MARVLNIFGNEFIEREDGLYECPGMCSIDKEQWAFSEYYGMSMLFVNTVDGLKAYVVRVDNSDTSVNAMLAVRNYLKDNCTQVSTLNCDPDKSFGVLGYEV